MTAYLVRLDPKTSGMTSIDGMRAVVVEAGNSTIAKQMAGIAAYADPEAFLADTGIDDASEVILGDTDWEGWTFMVTIHSGFGAGDDEPFTVTHVGAAGEDTDDVGAALVALLNANDDIASAAYNSTGEILTAAGSADGFGDQKLSLRVIPPGETVSVSSLVGTIVDEGVAAADLTVVLPDDGAIIPKIWRL